MRANTAPEPIFVNARRLAELLGVDRHTVENWVDAGMPAGKREKEQELRIELGVALKWVMAKHKREMEQVRERADPDGARAAKIAAEARLREMDVAEREGKLIDAAEAADGWTQDLTTIREEVMSIAGNAVQSGVIAPAQEMALEALCRDALVSVGRALRGGAPVDDESEEDE